MDSGYPTRTTAVTVQISVLRDTTPPVFSSANYRVTILEDERINDTIIVVAATDNDLEVRLSQFYFF